MNKRSIHLIFLVWAILILLLGIVLNKCKLHLWGKGIEYEEELTWGLTEYLGLEPATFYELNFLFVCLFWSGILLLILHLRKYSQQPDPLFDTLHMLSLIAFLTPFLIGIWNFQRIETIKNNEQKYTERYFETLDNSIKTTKRIKVELEEPSYQICFYSLLLFLVLFFALVFKIFYPKKKIGTDPIDHLFNE